MRSGFSQGIYFPEKVKKVIEEGTAPARWGNFHVHPMNRECFSYKLLIARWDPTLKEAWIHVRNNSPTTNKHISDLRSIFEYKMGYKITHLDDVDAQTAIVHGQVVVVPKTPDFVIDNWRV